MGTKRHSKTASQQCRYYEVDNIFEYMVDTYINGDASGLTDEEIRMVDEAMRKNNIEIVSPRYNEDMCTEPYFSRYPFFGLPTEVEDCDIIYHE